MTMKIPKGVALALQAALGIDPEEAMAKFNEAFTLIKNFVAHADGRMLCLIGEVNALKTEVASLRAQLEPSKEPTPDEFARNGSGNLVVATASERFEVATK